MARKATERSSGGPAPRRRAPAKKPAASKPAKAAAARTMRAAPDDAGPIPSGARVRMYRQGLGDCFLLTLPRTGGGEFHILIDCGVVVGTENARERLQDVVQDIIAATKREATRAGRATEGFVDVLVVTHEHYDHVAGFLLAEDLFAKPGEQGPGKLGVGEVWFAWTENPNDPLARSLRDDRAKKLQHLTALAQGMHAVGMADAPLARGLDGVLGFFGVDFTAEPPQAGRAYSGTQRAMEVARSLVEPDRVFYRKPGETPWESKDLAGVRFYVLGPPRDTAALAKTFAQGEVYHLAESGGPLDAFFAAAALPTPTEAEADQDDCCPFDRTYANPLPGRGQSDAARLPADLSAFLRQHYLGPSSDPSDPDQSWRRIDQDWLGAAAEFALQLDAATNNTSLVLAVETARGGPVLLFPGDAQVGSWLSWQAVEWKPEHEAPVTGRDLLARTALYKVGHHGSHNATLRAQGLELMPEGKLVAFVPVDQAMAARKHWPEMPLQSLVDELIRRTGGKVVRVDAPFPEALGVPGAVPSFTTPAAGSDADPLYHEWRVDLAPGQAASSPAGS